MIKQIKHLTKLELQNLYGWNVFRYTKDKSQKKKMLGLCAAWVFVLVMIID